jgi:dsRNA-specific ribonuclease
MAGSYERLEFLGDAVLDHIVVPKIFAHPRKLRAWELHRVRNALVNVDFLGYCCMKYGIEEEMQTVVFEPLEAKDQTPKLRQSTRQVHLHDFMQAGAEMATYKSHCLEAFEKYRGPVSEALDNGTDYPWPDLTAMRPQKFFSDLIESVLGALFIDTQGELSVCEAFVEKLGIFHVMRRILDEHMETARPKERVGILADSKTVEYVGSQSRNEEGVWDFTCAVMVGGEEIARAESCGTAEEADIRAASQAAEILQIRLEEHQKLASGGVRKKRKLDLAPFGLDQQELHLDDVDADVADTVEATEDDE